MNGSETWKVAPNISRQQYFEKSQSALRERKPITGELVKRFGLYGYEAFISAIFMGIFLLSIVLMVETMLYPVTTLVFGRNGFCCRRMVKVKKKRCVVHAPMRTRMVPLKGYFLLYLTLCSDFGVNAAKSGTGKENPMNSSGSITCSGATYPGPNVFSGGPIQDFGGAMSFEERTTRDRITAVQHAREFTFLLRENDLAMEVEGLRAQNHDGTIHIRTYGLREMDRGQRPLQLAIFGDDIAWEIVARIRRLWHDELGDQDYADVHMMDPQLPNYLSGGIDELHLLVDLRPVLGGIPILVLNLIRNEHDPNFGHEIRAARTNRETQCGDLFQVNSFARLCQANYVNCRCDEMNTWQFQVDAHEWLEVFSGQRVDLLTELQYSNLHEGEVEGDEHGLMQVNQILNARNGWAYVYTPGLDEPYQVLDHGRADEPILEYIEHIYRHRNHFAGALETYIIESQPVDLTRRQAIGYMVFETRRVPATSVGILLDIEFYANDRPAAPGGPHPNEEWRECIWIGRRQTRNSLIRLVNMEQFCLRPGDQCLVYHRGGYWNSLEMRERIITHGDYVQIKALQRNTRVQLSYQWQCAERGQPIEEAAQMERQVLGRLTRRRRIPREVRDGTAFLQISMKRKDHKRNGGNETFATFARTRLPPPGNGPQEARSRRTQRIRFDDEVIRVDNQGRTEKWRDHAISNDYVLGTCQRKEAGENNDFYNSFVTNIRFEKVQENNEIPRSLTLERKENYETTLDEPDPQQEKHGLKIILPISEDDLSSYRGRLNYEQKEECEDVKAAQSLYNWMNEIQIIPQYDRTEVTWKSPSQRWVWKELWYLQQADEFHFYMDGARRTDDLASAVVMYAKVGSNWYFGGFVYYNFGDEGEGYGSYEAELMSQAMSCKWANDEVRLQRFNYGTTPKIVMIYDSHAAGKAAEGSFGGKLDNHFFVVARSMYQFLQEGQEIDAQEVYQKAHVGDPGNESVDDVAKWALSQKSKQAPWSRLAQGDDLSFQWLWWIAKEHRGNPQSISLMDLLRLPKATASHDDRILKEMQVESKKQDVHKTTETSISVITYNINSVNDTGKKKNQKRCSPTTMDALTRLYAKQGVDIILLQETRLRRTLPGNGFYNFYQSFAGPKGQGGILIGIAKKKGGLGYEPIKVENIKVMHSDPELLVLRVHDASLKAIVLAGHAPHAAREADLIEAWWTQLRKMLKEKAPGWPVIGGIDANARLGSLESENIGNFQGTQENEGGRQLHLFCSETDTWCPSTFQGVQRGPGETWKHPNGAEARLDYVIAPMQWKKCRVKTRIAGELAMGNSLYDHRPGNGGHSGSRGARDRESEPEDQDGKTQAGLCKSFSPKNYE